VSVQHTPGPWIVHPLRAQVDCGVFDEEGILLPVCKLAWPTKYRSEDETLANGMLMAASPDLLALALQYRDDLRYPPTADSITRRNAWIDAVIKKATGA
jgi:hypothetical protein